MKHKVNIRVINKLTGRESKTITSQFMNAINNQYNIEIPENFKIVIR